GIAQACEISGGEYLPTVHGLVWVREGLAHPVVHAQVEVGEDEDRGLEALGQVEGAPAKLKALLHAGRHETDIARVTMAKIVSHNDVALRHTSRQTSAGSHPLDVPDDAGDLCKVGIASVLRHQRDTRSGRGRHGA